MHRPEDTGPARRRGAPDDEPLAGGASPEGGAGSGAWGEPDDQGPVYVFSREAIRELDRRCADEFAMPTLLLMENAARAVASAVLDLVEELAEPRVLVVCGTGNNGGDGLAAARHLHNAGVGVALVLARPLAEYDGDAGVNARIVAKMGLPVFVAAADDAPEIVEAAIERLGDPDLVVDAILGTGADRPAEDAALALIEAVNELRDEGGEGGNKGEGAVILAVDIPSGLDADSGLPIGGEAGAAVKADATVSLVGLKAGFLTMDAQAFLGEVVIADIGAPVELVERLGRLLEDSPHNDAPDGPMNREDLDGAAQRPG